MPTEDTEAETKQFEPVVFAGNASFLNTSKIKQLLWTENNLNLTYIHNCYLGNKCTTTQMGYLKYWMLFQQQLAVIFKSRADLAAGFIIAPFLFLHWCTYKKKKKKMKLRL